VASSGHAYFSLKDENATLKAVMWKSRLQRMSAPPMDGQLVRASGSITVYPPRGEYQIDVNSLAQAGLGLLQKRFEELKRRLESEGLFDPARKRQPPRPIRKVVVITSPTGAALHDFLRTLEIQGTPLEVLILPVRVQGVEAPPEIVAALQRAPSFDPDLIILTRGGGSLEDLWAFNEEAVAKAIAASSVPVLSAVGHEVDFTIADFVADLRASTPTAAAGFLAGEYSAILEELGRLQDRLTLAVTGDLDSLRADLRNLSSSLLARSPLSFLPFYRQRVDDLLGRGGQALRRDLRALQTEVERSQAGMESSMRVDLVRWMGYLKSQSDRLQVLDPLATLRRGYALCETADEAQLIRSIRLVEVGQDVRIHLSDGNLTATLHGSNPRSPDI
jgi:exodeoxyribonuclease VII large subunit